MQPQQFPGDSTRLVMVQQHGGGQHTYATPQQPRVCNTFIRYISSLLQLVMAPNNRFIGVQQGVQQQRMVKYPIPL